MRRTVLIVLVLIAATLVAQRSKSDAAVTSIHYSISAGMCRGYCSSDLSVEPKLATLLLTGRNDDHQTCADLKYKADLTEQTWRGVTDTVNRTALMGLPDVVGAPGATDFAIETIEVHFADGTTKKVAFDAGNQPAALNALKEKLHQLDAKLSPTARPQCAYK